VADHRQGRGAANQPDLRLMIRKAIVYLFFGRGLPMVILIAFLLVYYLAFR
jgi:hypothetical protein